MLTNNRIWKNRTINIGVIGAEEALNYGFRCQIQTQCEENFSLYAFVGPSLKHVMYIFLSLS